MNANKHIDNPIITIKDIIPSRKDFEIIGAFNAGTAQYKGKNILLIRIAERPLNYNSTLIMYPIFNSETKEIEIKSISKNDNNYDFTDPRIIKSKKGKKYLTSISHIRLACSDNGTNFEVSAKPLISAFDCYTSYGVEDARVTRIEGTYYINFSAASEYGIITRLMSTNDFENFHDLGNIFHPDNKDIAIFPQTINGLYYALHRPSTSEYGKPNIWIASSPDLVHWGDHKLVAAIREGKWDGDRIGASCVPFLTEKGWLEIYHGATIDNRYCLGAILFDREEPWKVIARSENPIIEPTEKYELEGFFGNVVFSCGLIKNGEKLNIYYGASDDSVCLASTMVSEILHDLGV